MMITMVKAELIVDQGDTLRIRIKVRYSANVLWLYLILLRVLYSLVISDDIWPQDRQSLETSKNKRHKVSRKPSSPPKYKRRKVADPMFEYLEGEKAQATKDSEVKMEIHRDMMKENKAGRLLKREQMMQDRERLQL